MTPSGFIASGATGVLLGLWAVGGPRWELAVAIWLIAMRLSVLRKGGAA